MGAHHSKTRPNDDETETTKPVDLDLDQTEETKKQPYRVNFKENWDDDRETLLQALPRMEGEEDLHRRDIKLAQISVGGKPMFCYDFGDMERTAMYGRFSVRYVHRHLLSLMDGIVHVIDSCTDLNKLDDVLAQIERELLDQLSDVSQDETPRSEVVMILASNQGAEGALPLEKIQEKIKETVPCHPEIFNKRCLFVAGCNEHREGLEEAMALFLDQLQRRREGRVSPGFTKLSALQEENKKEREAVSKDPMNIHFLKRMLNILAY